MISRCSGVVLAGGANTRFDGVAKGLLELGGRRVVDWGLDALSVVADELLLITNDPAVRAAVLGVSARGDARPERSSLVGLHSALTYCADAALVVAWDMPFVSQALLAALRHEGEQTGAAVIPEGPRGIEPMCGYYPRACVDVADRQIDAGEMRMSAFVEALPRRVIVPRGEVGRYGAPEQLFANVNTPADLAAARSLVRRRRSAPLELASLSDSQ
jgi:molybdenum cofactor guanylyltransferase